MRDCESREVSLPFENSSMNIANSWRLRTFSRCLGIENKKGTLRPGADADFVVMDRNGNVLNTWVAGRMVWEQPRRT